MPVLALNSLRPRQLDALREVATIGAGAAATALATLLRRKVTIEVPDLNVLTMREALQQMTSAHKPNAVVSLGVLGDVTGQTLQVLPADTASKLATAVIGEPCGAFPAQFGSLETSALVEVGNILTGAYLNTLSDFLGLMMIMSLPKYRIATGQEALAEMGALTDNAQVLHLTTHLHIEETGHRLDAHFVLMPDTASLYSILSALGLA